MTVRVLCGDCRAVLPTLPAASVQCCVTSPPYYGLRDYGVAGQLGLEATPEEYIATMVAVFREVRRVLRDDGTLWLNVGDSYSGNGTLGRNDAGRNFTGGGGNTPGSGNPGPQGNVSRGAKPKDLLMMPARLALALQADGWWLRSDIIWSKPNPMPESVSDRPTSAHEHVFLLSKRASYFYDAEAVAEPANPASASRYNYAFSGTLGADAINDRRTVPEGMREFNGSRNARNVWTIATAPFPEAHFATFPPELAERCIRAGTSEHGCCAQCGAPWVRQMQKSGGTTGKAWNNHENDLQRGHRGGDNGHNAAAAGWRDYRVEFIGWQPSCACGAATAPCAVLDPFGGAGTTGLVADRLQRNAILIELNQAYAVMARNRVWADAPLLAEVAD